MAKHEEKTTGAMMPLFRPLLDIEPKLVAGLASSVTVGAIITAGQQLGLAIPSWLAVLIVIGVYLLAGYLTRSRIPVPIDSGLTAQQVALVGGASAVGAELGDGDLRAAAEAAFAAVGIPVDDDGNVTDLTHPLVAGADPAS